MFSSEESFRLRNLLRHCLSFVNPTKEMKLSKVSGDPGVRWHLIWALNVYVVATATVNLKCVLLSVLSCQKLHDFDLFLHNLYIYSRKFRSIFGNQDFLLIPVWKKKHLWSWKKHMLTSFEFFRSAKRWICRFKNIILQRSVFKVNPGRNTFLFRGFIFFKGNSN